jgi:hypothetical protein
VTKHRCSLEGGNGRASVATKKKKKKKKKKQALSSSSVSFRLCGSYF